MFLSCSKVDLSAWPGYDFLGAKCVLRGAWSHTMKSRKKRGADPCIRVGRLAEHSVDKKANEGAWPI